MMRRAAIENDLQVIASDVFRTVASRGGTPAVRSSCRRGRGWRAEILLCAPEPYCIRSLQPPSVFRVRRLRHDEAAKEAGRATTQVSRVVDAFDREAQDHVDDRPPYELHHERFGLGSEPIPVLEEEADEGAQQPEDGARGADAGLRRDERAGERAR